MNILLLVKNIYFKGPNNYISQTECVNYWAHKMKLTYLTIMNVEKIKSNMKKLFFG